MQSLQETMPKILEEIAHHKERMNPKKSVPHSIEELQLIKKTWTNENGDEWIPGIKLTREQVLTKAIPEAYGTPRLTDFTFPIDSEESLFIFSPTPGTGKTHLAYAILSDFLMFNAHQRRRDELEEDRFKLPILDRNNFTTAGALQIRFRACMNHATKETEEEIITDISSARLFILDDLGGMRASTATDYSVECIFQILNNRYANKKRTIITSNKSLAQIAETFDDRISSRIAGMGRIVELKGSDRRLQKAVK